MRAMDDGIDNIKAGESLDQAGQGKGGADNENTDEALPDFGPGGFDFFGIAVGIDKFVASHNELNNHKKSGDNGDEFDDIANESEKSLAGLVSGLDIFFDGIRRFDIT